jgi:hypothetical protein
VGDRGWLTEHLGSRRVSRTVYGSIIGLALVLTLEAHPTGTATIVGSLLATALAVGLAELYSELVGARTLASVGGQPAPLREVAGDVGAVAFGIAFPCVFFLGSALGLLDQDAAFTLAKWTGLGLIAGYGYLAARLSGGGTSRALLEALAVAAIGAVLIALKALVH